MSNIVKKVKNLALSIGFFNILHWEYLLKHTVVVIQTPDWKSKANILEMSHLKDVRLFKSFEFGNGSRMSDEKLV